MEEGRDRKRQRKGEGETERGRDGELERICEERLRDSKGTCN